MGVQPNFARSEPYKKLQKLLSQKPSLGTSYFAVEAPWGITEDPQIIAISANATSASNFGRVEVHEVREARLPSLSFLVRVSEITARSFILSAIHQALNYES